MLGMLVLAAAAVSQGPNPTGALRLVHLELEATPHFEAESLSATAHLRVENRSAAPVAEVTVLLNRLLAVSRASAPDGRALRIGQTLTAMADFEKFQVRAATIALGTPLPPGAATTVTIAYSGWIAPYTETGMLYVRDQVDSAFTILRADALSIPVVSAPSMAEWRAGAADFTFRVRVTAPRHLVVAAGGRETGRSVGDSLTTWEFTAARPAPFLLVAIAPYAVIEREGIRVYHFPADSAGARTVADRAGQALARLAGWFGPLREAPGITIMEIPDGWGSQASLVSGIIQSAAAFRDPGRLGELYHELSHLWNAPDLERPSARWNEGLATFLERRMRAELDGDDLAEASERLFRWFQGLAARRTVLAEVPFRDFGVRGLTDNSYGLGGVMFSVLFARLGADRFDAAYRALWTARAGKGVTFEDLQRAFLSAAPGQGLEQFFEEWVATTRWTAAVREAPSFRALAARPAGG